MPLEYKEYLLSTNIFKEPTVITGNDAIATLLTRLILLEPGTDPIRPTMGVGIVSKFRYMTIDRKAELEDTITKQIATFLPHLQCVGIEIVFNEDKTVDIKITIDGTIYVYDSSSHDIPITLSSIRDN